MPDLTMASAICRIISSLTLHPNLFQLFHPMGGVRAMLEETPCWETTGKEQDSNVKTATQIRFVGIFLRKTALIFVSEGCGWENFKERPIQPLAPMLPQTGDQTQPPSTAYLHAVRYS